MSLRGPHVFLSEDKSRGRGNLNRNSQLILSSVFCPPPSFSAPYIFCVKLYLFVAYFNYYAIMPGLKAGILFNISIVPPANKSRDIN